MKTASRNTLYQARERGQLHGFNKRTGWQLPLILARKNGETVASAWVMIDQPLSAAIVCERASLDQSSHFMQRAKPGSECHGRERCCDASISGSRKRG